MIYCKIADGVVIDRAIFDTEMPDGWPDFDQWVRDDEAQIGWMLVEGSEIVPPAPEPVEPLIPVPRLPNLEPDQFWFVVRVSGHAEDLSVWLSTLHDTDPVEWAAASSKLEFAKFFERDHPFVEAAREALGIPSEQLDALWQYGAQS